MATVSFKGSADQIATLRGRAINTYAGLEQFLCNAFIRFGEMEPEVASIIFFKITNARSRNEILDKLKKRAWKDQYNIFWNSLVKEINQIDGKRNEIVHWHTRTNLSGDKDKLVSSFGLQPGSLYSESPPKTAEDLEEFIVRCGRCADALNMFTMALYDLPQILAQPPWPEIFQLPLTYPIQSGHPLSPRPSIPDSPPRSS